MRLTAASLFLVLMAACAPTPAPSAVPSLAIVATPAPSPSSEPEPSNPYGSCEAGNRSALIRDAEIVRDTSLGLGPLYLVSARLVSDMCEGSVVVTLDRMGLETYNGLRICALPDQTATVTKRYNATAFPFTLPAGDMRTIAMVFGATIPTTGELTLVYDERTPCLSN